MTLFENISYALSLKKLAKNDGRHPSEKSLSILKRPVILVECGLIKYIGSKEKIPKYLKIKKTIDLKNRPILPAFTECHTHTVFAGNRSGEFEQRNLGESYESIAKSGGGIQSTVKATRKTDINELVVLAQSRVDRFIEQGVSCLETKSGYGLNLKQEEKLLKAARGLKKIKIVSTYLGPHALSPEFKKRGLGYSDYLDSIIQSDLAYLNAEGLVDRADIFVDRGYFSLRDLKKYIVSVKNLDLNFCVHADQLARTGASVVAAENSAQSIEHAIHLTDRDIQKISQTDTTAVLLPTADIYIHSDYPKARKMIDEGIRVAVATDFNPGSSPTQDLSFVGMLARLEMKMSLPEVISAYTYNSARSLGLHHERGSLEVGKVADFCVLDQDWDELFYSVGKHEIRHLFRSGKKLY
ncbi:MAG: imidazolonepropionase [Bdellovibrionales bacterium]